MTFQYGQFWEDLIEDLADPEFREAYIDASLRFMQEFHEQKLEEEKLFDSYEEIQERTHDQWTDCTGRKFWVHKRTVDCDIDGCAIHNPSYHPLSNAKQYMRADKSWLIERICEHGIGHPDPDSASFIAKQEGNGSIWVHGCDGCCQEKQCGAWDGCHLPEGHNRGRADIPENHRGRIKSSYDRKPSGWGPHVHEFVWFDDDNGHSGSFCRCGQEDY